MISPFARLRCFLVIALLAIPPFAAPGPAPKQSGAPRPVTAADYARAEKFLAAAVSSLIVGGAERQLQALARGLKERGFEWSFFTLKGAGAVGKELAAEGFQLEEGAGRNPARWLRLAAALADYDLIVGLDHNNVLRTLPAAARFLPPYVVLYHLQAQPPPAWRRALKGAAAVVVVAHSQRRLIAATRAAAGIHVIPNGVALPAADDGARKRVRQVLRIPAGKTAAVAVARLSPEKGLDVLIAAAARLEPTARPHLIIVGDGPEKAALEALAGQRLGGGCDFRGELADVTPAYRGADFFVLPSRQESAPLALLEAMSFGLAAVGPATGDVAAIIGDAGLTFEPGDAASLAHALEALVADEPARRAMGERARASVAERYSADKMLAAYEELFRRAARRP